MSAAHFEHFRKNLGVRNAGDISTSYKQITKRLNKDYWNQESETNHCLQVGSYGRSTAIHGVSDLDMVFELPLKALERFRKVEGNGPSQMLQEVKNCLQERYPTTKMSGDGQVVVVEFAGYRIEVLPAFLQVDGSYIYGDTNDGGRWPTCKPRHEIDAFNTTNKASNRNLKRVCKMLRAWKEFSGAPMSGMLIDTLTHNFFQSTNVYDDKSYACYPELFRHLFSVWSSLPEQDYWIAPGSKQRVTTSGKFQRKAKSAAIKCQEAIDAESEKKEERLWREVFGSRFFPALSTSGASSLRSTQQTEQFIEAMYPMDIRFDLDIECNVSHRGKDEGRLRWLHSIFPWLSLGRSLSFYVASCNVPEPYEVLWKVRNVGPHAEARNQIRGQIVADKGSKRIGETTSFAGPHFVECYVVKGGYCVARDRIDVPIGES